MKDCIGIGRLLGHRYRARETVTRFERSDDAGTVKQLDRAYHGDTCERCGDRLGIGARQEVHGSASDIQDFDTSTNSVRPAA